MQLKGTPLPHKLHSQLEEFEKRTNPEAKKNGALKGLTKLAPKHSADGHKAVLPSISSSTIPKVFPSTLPMELFPSLSTPLHTLLSPLVS